MVVFLHPMTDSDSGSRDRRLIAFALGQGPVRQVGWHYHLRFQALRDISGSPKGFFSHTQYQPNTPHRCRWAALTMGKRLGTAWWPTEYQSFALGLS